MKHPRGLQIMILKATIILIFLAHNFGCTTTQQSRELARDLSKQINNHIKDRRTSINLLNANYLSTFAVLLSEQRNLSKDRLRLERDMNARAMADSLLTNWSHNTTFSAIAENLNNTRENQLLSIKKRANSITRARQQYIESYSKLNLELKKMEQVKGSLVDLTEDEGNRQRTLEFLIMLGKAYNNVQKEENQ